MSDSFTLTQLLQQEMDSRLVHFDFTLAWQLGQGLYQRATDLGAPVAIEVFAFGQVLFFAVLPGASAENSEWAIRKRNTVLRGGHASMYIGRVNQQKGEPMATQAFMDQTKYTDHGGAFPLLNRSGAILGAVSVSGLPSHEDHVLALWGIQQIQALAG